MADARRDTQEETQESPAQTEEVVDVATEAPLEWLYSGRPYSFELGTDYNSGDECHYALQVYTTMETTGWTGKQVIDSWGGLAACKRGEMPQMGPRERQRYLNKRSGLEDLLKARRG